MNAVYENAINESDPHKGPPNELSQYDKCMFANLYCNDLVRLISVLEKQQIVLKLFPNPTDGTTTLSLELESAGNLTITLNDLLGSELFELHNAFTDVGTFTKTFSMEKLPVGVYYLKIIHNGNTKVEKVIKN